jgi:hypothetical protein
MNHKTELCKVFSPHAQARIDLFSDASTSSAGPDSAPMAKSYAGAFNALCDDLAAVSAKREAAERDTARRQMALAERQAAEAQRNRRQSAQRATRLAKSMQNFIRETPAKVARFAKAMTAPVPSDSPAMTKALAELDALHIKMEASRQQDAVRDKFAELYSLAKAGRLPAMDVCRLDAMRIRAVEQGLQL